MKKQAERAIINMKDKQGRDINYLRISVTKRCNLSCSYCGSKKASAENELTLSEIIAITELLAQKGITKVRLTGGEPLVREDLCDIAREIKKIPGIKELYVTTNGILLKEKAKALKEAGVDGVNISLDTLDKEIYKALTGTDSLNQVLDGIDEALRTGFSSVKINSVLIKGKNENEAERLIGLAREKPLDVRFIELMPFSGQGEKEELVVTENELLGKFPYLLPCKSEDSSVAKYFTADDFQGRVGFISPRSHKFCSKCNRIRLLADGRLKPCLGNDKAYDIRPFIGDKELLSQKIEEIIYNKPLSHHFEDGENFRGLNLIGG